MGAVSLEEKTGSLHISENDTPIGVASSESVEALQIANESSEFEDLIPDRASSEVTVVSDSDVRDDKSVLKRPQESMSGNQRDPRFRSSFAGLETSDDELPPQLADSRLQLSPQLPKQGLLPFNGGNRAKNWSSQGSRSSTNGTYSAMGVRREQTKIESLESENFQLKLKITNMERDQRALSATNSQDELANLREKCAKYQARALEMESRVDKLMAQRRREYDDDIKELELELTQSREEVKKLQKDVETETKAAEEARASADLLRADLDQSQAAKTDFEESNKKLDAELQRQKDALKTLEEALEESKQRLQEETRARASAESALQSNEEMESEAVDRVNELFESLSQLSYEFIPSVKVKSSSQGILELSKLIVDVFDYVDEVQATLSHAMEQLETISTKASEQEQLLQAASHAFGSNASHHQLPMQIVSMLNELQALEDQLKQHEQHKVEIVENMERGHQNTLHELEEKLRVATEGLATSQQRYTQLIDKVEEANHRSYNIVKIFFRRISAQMGAEYMDRINSELSAIVAKCESTGKSKLPLLTDLMAEYVDEFCKLAKSPNRLLRETQDLKEKVRSLESILTEELKHRGADAVLMARFKDLEMRYKDEQEKRRLDYDSYQRKLANMST